MSGQLPGVLRFPFFTLVLFATLGSGCEASTNKDEDAPPDDTDTDHQVEVDTGSTVEVTVVETVGCAVPQPRAYAASAWFSLDEPWKVDDPVHPLRWRSVQRGMLLVGGLPTSPGFGPEGSDDVVPFDDAWVLDLSNLDAVKCPWIKVQDDEPALARWGAQLLWLDENPLDEGTDGGVFRLGGGFEVDGNHGAYSSGDSIDLELLTGITVLPSVAPPLLLYVDPPVVDALWLSYRPIVEGSRLCDVADIPVESVCSGGRCGFLPNGGISYDDTFVIRRGSFDPCDPPQEFPATPECTYEYTLDERPGCRESLDPFCLTSQPQWMPGVAFGVAARLEADVLIGGTSGCYPVGRCSPWLEQPSPTDRTGLFSPNSFLEEDPTRWARREVMPLVSSTDAIDMGSGAVSEHTRDSLGGGLVGFAEGHGGVWGSGGATLGRRWDTVLNRMVPDGAARAILVGGTTQAGVSPRWKHDMGAPSVEPFEAIWCDPDCIMDDGFTCLAEPYGNEFSHSADIEHHDEDFWAEDPRTPGEVLNGLALGRGTVLGTPETVQTFSLQDGWRAHAVGMQPIVHAAVAAVSGQRALVVGGVHNDGSPSPSITEIDLRSGSPTATSRGSLCVSGIGCFYPYGASMVYDWPTGRAFLFGGQETNATLRIDVVPNPWRQNDLAQVEVVGEVGITITDVPPEGVAVSVTAPSQDLVWVTQQMELSVSCRATSTDCYVDDLDLWFTNVSRSSSVQMLSPPLHLSDLDGEIRAGRNGDFGEVAVLWPEATIATIPRKDGKDFVNCLPVNGNCPKYDSQHGMRERIRLPFVAAPGDLVRLYVRHRVNLDAADPDNYQSGRLVEPSSFPTCKDLFLGPPALAGLPIVPSRATRYPTPAWMGFKRDQTADNGNYPEAFLSQPDVKTTFTLTRSAQNRGWYGFAPGFSVGVPDPVHGFSGWREPQIGSFRRYQSVLIQQGCGRLPTTFLGTWSSPDGLVHAYVHDSGELNSNENSLILDYFQQTATIDLQYLSDVQQHEPAGPHINFVVREAPSLGAAGMTRGWGATSLYPTRLPIGIENSLRVGLRHEPLHFWNYLVEFEEQDLLGDLDMGRPTQRSGEWFFEPLFRQVHLLGYEGMMQMPPQDMLTTAIEQASNAAQGRCSVDAPLHEEYATQVVAQATALHAAHAGGVDGEAAAMQAWGDFFAALRLETAGYLLNRVLDEAALRRLFDGYTGETGFYDTYTRAGPTGCVGFPLLNVSQVSPSVTCPVGDVCTWGTAVPIIITQDQSALASWRQSFPVVATQLSCTAEPLTASGSPAAGAAVDMLNGCTSWLDAGGVPLTRPTILRFPQNSVSVATTTLQPGAAAPVFTQLSALPLLGQPPLLMREAGWCGGPTEAAALAPSFNCGSDTDADGYLGADCDDGTTTRRPGVADAMGSIDFNCDCYILGTDANGEVTGRWADDLGLGNHGTLGSCFKRR